MRSKKADWLSLFTRQKEQLATESAEVVKDTLSSSLMNGYQGLFPDKFRKGTHHGNHNGNRSSTASIAADRTRFISGADSPERIAADQAWLKRTEEENRHGPPEG